ncbi:hypothetical protein L1275_000814 [Flavobacterium sp. HSC-61S13]|nr:hypothetical protein [Flavobacterium sp. HSC-61S13]
MMQLIGGALCIIVSSIYLLYLKKRDLSESDLWDKSTVFKGYIGGVGIFIIGVILMYRFFA